MSQKLPAHQTAKSDAKIARKRYEAPRLEEYGTVQELTRTSYYGSFDIADVGTYYTSGPF